ncbi:hypothetical protein LPJ56_004150 [Coemansia sp. RSA 2599]|nr:hypothetical protein LPJ56_004150 [Coemansia sp. RSA 2599]
MSMPVAAHGSGCRRVSVAAAAAAAIQRHNSRRQSAVSDDPDRSTQNRHFSVHNPYGIRYQQQQQQQQYQQSRRQHKRNHYSMDPRLLESARAGRNTRMPSIHEDIARADEDGDGGNVRCYADYPDCLDGPYSIGGVLSAPAGVGSSASAVAATAAAADTASGGIAVPGTRPIHVVLARTSQPTSGQWPYAIDVHGSAYCAAPMRASAAAATSAAAPMPEAVSSSSALKPAASGNQSRLSNQVKAVDSRRGVRGAIARLFGRIGLPSVDGQQQKSHGQIQRIERRVHTLVATGALRVATRAMVPLVTQLCMVIWSTTHSLLPEPSGSNSSGASKDSVLYSVAILLLSLQGILDMALYFIYDTHSDASEVSLPGSAYPMLASSHHVNMIHAGGGIYGKSPVGNYAQTHQPSLLHLHGDIYYTGSYTPRGSQDAYMHANHYYSQPSHHHMHGLRRWGSTARQTANHYGRPNSFTSANSNGSNLSTGGAVASSNGGHGGAYGMVGGVGGSNNGGGVNSSGRIGIGGPGDIAADGSRLAGAATGGSALDRKFAFNMESLNIRRVDRTSNAMQSDTLNGSDCMAWSHTDGLSVHDAPSTISLFSASGPVHNYSHRPVLSGWEEIELEDVGQSFDYHHRHQQQQQQQQQHCADNWSSTDISRAEL